METLHYELERIKKNDHDLVFKNNGKLFNLKSDALKKITISKFNTADSTDAKMIIASMDEMRSDTNPRGKSVRDRFFIKIYFNKRASFASGLGGSKCQEANVTQGFIFLSEIPDYLFTDYVQYFKKS